MTKAKNWGPTIIRLVLGAIFVKHGWGKVQGLWFWLTAGAEWEFINHVAFMPVLPAWLWASAAALTEFIGGILVFLGLWSRIASAFIGVVMLVAIFGVHLPAGDSIEFQVALLAMAISLILTGSGRYSVRLKK